jgi:hypothetical protein
MSEIDSELQVTGCVIETVAYPIVSIADGSLGVAIHPAQSH